MADAGLFVGWGAVVRGREAESLEVFNETLAYFAGQRGSDRELRAGLPRAARRRSRRIHPRARGCGLVAAIRVSDEFTQLMIRAGFIVDGLGVVGADLAGRLQQQMEYYTSQIGAFA